MGSMEDEGRGGKREAQGCQLGTYELTSKQMIPNRGLAAEDRVHLFAERSFFSDFVFRTPAYRSGKASREAGDVVVWFDDTLIIVQSKARCVDDSTLLLPFSERERNWATKNLRRAVRQLLGSKRALMDGRVRTLVNPRRGEIPFVPTDIRKVFGLVIIDQAVEPYDPLSLAPDIVGADLPIHVFALSEWPLLCSELSTTPDFISYLEFRSPLLGKRRLLVGQEADLLAFFIIRERNPKVAFDEIPEVDGLGHWFAENMRAELAARNVEDRWSYLIDDIIDRLHDVDEPATVVPSAPRIRQPDEYATVAVELSKLDRMSRRILGRKLGERIELAAKENRERYSAAKVNDTGFLFLASPYPRPERSKNLAALTALSKHNLKVHTAVGVATEASIGRGRSYDTVWLSYPWGTDPEADSLSATSFASPSVLSDTEFSGAVEIPV